MIVDKGTAQVNYMYHIHRNQEQIIYSNCLLIILCNVVFYTVELVMKLDLQLGVDYCTSITVYLSFLL